ncbi:branched-chain amino acid ABC transporter permease [Thermus thermophilus]|uniref:branched-chain amino acid ABC transporter permease n=1 Tax=Thermus thermophilus TaxID=274 RepID=UPI0015F35A1B|nr:branched-chain amino acid ABC transporter permease [Thermus thermophilus]QMV30130.1 branched-chain amino acid ABC transporter permease [Thermus thermophilus]WMV95486.1 branched-chain amino acid ABC transporter permease [Thermus thermophilus HB27]
MRNPWAQTGNYRTRYEQDASIFATHRELVSLLLSLGFLLVLPQFLSRTQVFILDLILVYSIAVLGLNITTGYAGLINIGQAAFMGVGAYTAALLAPAGFPFYLVLPAAGLAGAFFGYLVGIPSLRVKHLYLAMATLAFQVVFEWTVGHLPLLNQGGAMPLPRVGLLGYEVGFRNHYHFWYYVSFAVLVLLALFFRNLLRTKYGRALVAVRDNDRAADAMGMDPGRTKLFAFALGAFYAGVAGALYAYLSRAVVIEDYTFSVSIKLLAMAIVGGLGTLVGSFLGPAFLELLDVNMEALSNLIKALGFSVAGVDVASALRPLAFGLVIVLFLVFEPRGLYNWWRVVRSYFRTWPFRY